MRLDIDAAGSTGKLLVAESIDVDVLVYDAISHIHQIITLMHVFLPALQWTSVYYSPLIIRIIIGFPFLENIESMFFSII